MGNGRIGERGMRQFRKRASDGRGSSDIILFVRRNVQPDALFFSVINCTETPIAECPSLNSPSRLRQAGANAKNLLLKQVT
jgi:hypothetical protein